MRKKGAEILKGRTWTNNAPGRCLRHPSTLQSLRQKTLGEKINKIDHSDVQFIDVDQSSWRANKVSVMLHVGFF